MNSADARNLALTQFRDALALHQKVVDSPETVEKIADWAKICADSLTRGGVIFMAGNGGSFADAQHLIAELTGKLGRMRRPLAGIALGTNNSSISAIGNDFGYEFTFSRELEALFRPNSVLIALTTSGNSTNILKLIEQAQVLGMPTFVLTGSNGGVAAEISESICVPSARTERIQEMHILLGHTMCLLIEEFLGIFDTELIS
jgi:D-sedoheptulose 7-phosphate isomerase